MTDRKSWTVKDEGVLDDLSKLISLSEDECKLLASYQEQAETVASQLAEAFYARIEAHPNTAEFVAGQVDHLKQTLQQWFVELFSGQYDRAYTLRRLRIGRVHVQIGLPIRYPLAMVDLIVEYGEQATGQNPEAMAAFQKLLAMDIAIFNEAYESQQLQHLAEMVGNERLARRLLTQEQAT